METAAEVSVSEIVQNLQTQNDSVSEDEPQIEVEEAAKVTPGEARRFAKKAIVCSAI